MTNVTPASDDNQVVSEPAETPVVTPEIPEVPAAPNEEVVEPVVVEEAPSEPAPVADEKATLQKRFEGALADVQAKNDEVRKIVELQADLVSSNPDLIHQIASRDPILANKVVNKIWGNSGIKSYKQLIQRVQLESIKEENPELYETKSKLSELEARLAEKDEREQRLVRKQFLSSKNIQENEYDPKYMLLQDALDSLNPELVKNDYEKALDLAHKIAFSDGSAPITPVSAPKVTLGGGIPPAALPAQKPQVSEQSSWLAQGLNEKLGYKIT